MRTSTMKKLHPRLLFGAMATAVFLPASAGAAGPVAITPEMAAGWFDAPIVTSVPAAGTAISVIAHARVPSGAAPTLLVDDGSISATTETVAGAVLLRGTWRSTPGVHVLQLTSGGTVLASRTLNVGDAETPTTEAPAATPTTAAPLGTSTTTSTTVPRRSGSTTTIRVAAPATTVAPKPTAAPTVAPTSPPTVAPTTTVKIAAPTVTVETTQDANLACNPISATLTARTINATSAQMTYRGQNGRPGPRAFPMTQRDPNTYVLDWTAPSPGTYTLTITVTGPGGSTDNPTFQVICR